ncbi:MAG: DUF4124 domain-containing protein [Tahibacter sp.]
MRCLPLALLPCFVVLPSSEFALADTGYKCVDAQGQIAFQDRPCRADQNASSFHYESTPPQVVTASPDASPDATPAPLTTQPILAPAAESPRAAIPDLFICSRGDGGEPYYSDSGATVPYIVPLGVLGYPARSLGEVYGGRDGIGVSAPEYAHPPILPPGAASAIAGASVWVRDDCRPLPARETCRVRNRQLDEVRSKLHRAFKDQRAILEPRERALAQQVAGC